MTILHIDYPEELLDQADQTKEALERLAREALLVRLYDLGKISYGKGAELLGITRWEFLDLLGAYGVSIFDDTQDVAAEAQLALDASRFQHKPAD
jgi:predicted HTH domain antitoxin